MKMEISDKLFELGITPNLKGFNYICEAIEYIISSKEYAIGNVYRAVAEKHQFANYASIERTIRYAIRNVDQNAWSKIGVKGLRNAEFLYTLAFIFKRETTNE